MCICSICCLQFRLEKSWIFSAWKVLTLQIANCVIGGMSVWFTYYKWHCGVMWHYAHWSHLMMMALYNCKPHCGVMRQNARWSHLMMMALYNCKPHCGVMRHHARWSHLMTMALYNCKPHCGVMRHHAHWSHLMMMALYNCKPHCGVMRHHAHWSDLMMMASTTAFCRWQCGELVKRDGDERTRFRFFSVVNIVESWTED